jgi:hypothetical protein
MTEMATKGTSRNGYKSREIEKMAIKIGRFEKWL